MLSLNPDMQSLFSTLIIFSLLLNFVLIGSRWIKNYIIGFSAECWIIGLLAFGVGYFTHTPDLYIIGFFTWIFRGIIFPILLAHMIKKLKIERELNTLIPTSTSLLLSITLVVFSFNDVSKSTATKSVRGTIS